MVSNCMSQLLEVSGREACCEQHCRIQRPAPVPFPASPHMPPSRVACSRRAHDQAADKREKPTRRSITQCPDKVYEGELSSSAASRGCDHPTGLASSKTAHRLSKERRRNMVLKFPA